MQKKGPQAIFFLTKHLYLLLFFVLRLGCEWEDILGEFGGEGEYEGIKMVLFYFKNMDIY